MYIGFKKLRKKPEELVEIIRQLDEDVLVRALLGILHRLRKILAKWISAVGTRRKIG